MATTTRRTQAERRALSERRVLDAAAQLIAARGTSDVSFTEIATAAGCARGLPGYLFGTKAYLLDSLVRDLLHQFMDDVLRPRLDRGGLVAVLTVARLFLRMLAPLQEGTHAIYVLIGESLEPDAPASASINEHHRAIRDMFRGWIIEGIEAGEIRADLHPDSAAVLLLAQLRGLGLLAIADPDAYDLRRLSRELKLSITAAFAA